MTMSLVVLLPLILLGIVGTLCFVGCGLSTGGLETPFTKYTSTTILLNPAIIAYWPLGRTGGYGARGRTYIRKHKELYRPEPPRPRFIHGRLIVLRTRPDPT